MVKLPKKGLTDQPISTDIGMVFQYLFEETEKIASPKDIAMNHTPVVDIFSTQDSIIIEVEMPGVRKDEVDISILHNAITVRGLKYECFEEKKINFVCMERSFGRLFRVIDIPCSVDTTRIKAVCKDGLLTITLPRVAEKRGIPKKITVES
ncbi:MAG: Hsp20/alpha crystallin family protein [Deltaproteobacteria bacterium]|nr:Hsp20/alpha crystallin family protein [Deltaproteobacteria bacterium]